MLNHVTVMGRLVADPELRTTPSGVSMCNIRLACDRDYKDKATGERETDWLNVTAWRGTADYINQYFTKGRMIVVSGRIQTRNYTDKDGNKRTATDIVAENAYFADSKRDGVTQADPMAQLSESKEFKELANDEDLPF